MTSIRCWCGCSCESWRVFHMKDVSETGNINHDFFRSLKNIIVELYFHVNSSIRNFRWILLFVGETIGDSIMYQWFRQKIFANSSFLATWVRLMIISTESHWDIVHLFIYFFFLEEKRIELLTLFNLCVKRFFGKFQFDFNFFITCLTLAIID